MTKPGKITHNWVELSIHKSLRNYVNWNQLGVVAGLITVIIGGVCYFGLDLFHIADDAIKEVRGYVMGTSVDTKYDKLKDLLDHKTERLQEQILKFHAK